MSDTAVQTVDLMLVGHLALDQVVVMGQQRARLGSAVFFGAFAARAMDISQLVVTKLSPADQQQLEVFKQASIPVHWTPSAHTTGIRNIYTTADQDRRTCVLIHAGDPFEIGEIPDIQVRIIHLGPLLAGQVSEPVIQQLWARALRWGGELSLDAQGFTRVVQGEELRNRPWTDGEQILGRVTYLKADAAEAEALTGETDLDRAVHALADLGPREVVLTHASGVRVLANSELTFAPFDARCLEGRTGRGDTCMASYLSARLQGHPPAWAGRWAAALTSLKMEKDGPFAGTKEQVLNRMGPGA